MSRIGEAPIIKPVDVTIEKSGEILVVKGPKGVLSLSIHPLINVEMEGETLTVKRKNEEKKTKALHGLTRSLIANMITGVKDGWSKNLELVGVGFRAIGASDKLTLNIGFSHPVEISAPEGITFTISDNTKIQISGIDKQMVGQTAANIRSLKPPDVYKGKGIRYAGEYVRKKLGKAGKVGAGTVGGGK